AVSPSSLSFSSVAGGANPASQSLSVTNSGGGSLSYTVSDDAAWLSESPASGTAPGSPSVSVNATGLAAGTYTATITVDGGGVSGSPKTVPVSLTVSPAQAPGGTLMGSEAVGTDISSAPAGAAEAYQMTAAVTGNASKLRAYVDSG